MIIESWKNQFTSKQLSLVHEEPFVFVKCQWQRDNKPNILYLIYRWFIALIFLVTIIISIIDLRHPDSSAEFRAKWLIYLTNWGYTLCTVQSLLAAFMVTWTVRSAKIPQRTIYKIYWVTNIIATDIAFGITSLYWTIIYDKKVMPLDTMNILVHGNNSVLMLIDLMMVAHPVKILHFCYPVLFGLSYTTFSLIFYAANGISREGHRYIYVILNWDKPGTTVLICMAVLVFIVVIHLISWSIYRLRLYLAMHRRSRKL